MSHTTQAEHKEEAGITIPTPIPMPSAAQAPTENKDGKRGFREWLNILAYPVAAISGALVWRTQVYEESYASHNRKKDFEKISEESLAKHADIRENPNLSPSEKLKEINKNINKYNETRDLKFRSMGYKNVWNHYSSISGSAKNNSFIAGFTVTGIALGVMLTIANSKNLFASKDEENKKGGMSK